ncbi:conserved hypothetical protein [Coccidioides posadasii str. Silveira]|uniref:Uncharacterized protein n=1 Tax=Coccidioides posadasii (strain RMSCC 757 / Silveira) TaxID=443226 RepID=E9CUE6_COCPS|nr:conserved hypothetical protein [Coccidioides posadasii str. Silveira]
MWPALDQSIRRPLEPRTTSTLSPRAIPTADPSHVQTRPDRGGWSSSPEYFHGA